MRVRRAGAAAMILPLLLATVAFAASKTPSHKPGSYAGTSSEHSPVTFKVSKSGTSIQGFKTVIGYDGKCGQGGGAGFTAAASTIAIQKARFSITTTFKGPVASVPAKRGTITGRLLGAAVTGTVTIPSLKFHGCLAYTETYTARWKSK